MVGELDAGKPHVQFDEGVQETGGLSFRACALLYSFCSPVRYRAVPRRFSVADVVVVISKLYDLIVWLAPLTEKFPRSLLLTRRTKTFSLRM